MSSDNNKANVSTGKPKIGGAVYRAPAGTSVPTSATATLHTAFTCVGYISDAGVVNDNSLTVREIKAWGGDTVLVADNGQTDTFQFAMIESMKPEVLKAYYGDAAVTGTIASGLTVTANSVPLSESAWVIDMELNGNVKKRLTIPDGKVSAKGSITYKDDTVISYPLTITALPDASENTHYDYMVKAS